MVEFGQVCLTVNYPAWTHLKTLIFLQKYKIIANGEESKFKTIKTKTGFLDAHTMVISLQIIKYVHQHLVQKVNSFTV